MSSTASSMHRPWGLEIVDVVAAVSLFLSPPLLRSWHSRWGPPTPK
jgi:hypothetical protein